MVQMGTEPQFQNTFQTGLRPKVAIKMSLNWVNRPLVKPAVRTVGLLIEDQRLLRSRFGGEEVRFGFSEDGEEDFAVGCRDVAVFVFFCWFAVEDISDQHGVIEETRFSEAIQFLFLQKFLAARKQTLALERTSLRSHVGRESLATDQYGMKNASNFIKFEAF